MRAMPDGGWTLAIEFDGSALTDVLALVFETSF